jgi:ankyrin repeat protein
MPPAARSVEELFPLIEFCTAGDLKAVSDWIAKGNPLDLPAAKKTRRVSPLQIAIEKGFLTLTETLLDAGADPSNNGNALWIAVRAKRIDIVRLLLDRGVPVNSIDFESVCYSCDPELIQLFLDRGADAITGYPLYRGFQNCLKPIIAVYKPTLKRCRRCNSKTTWRSAISPKRAICAASASCYGPELPRREDLRRRF